jgi:hypothetical protein
MRSEGGGLWDSEEARRKLGEANKRRRRDVSITLDTYSHAIPALQEEAAARIAELVFAAK